jgi:predicted DNA-binding mobile mystery protein A
MTDRQQRLLLEQLDRKILPFKAVANIPVPETGWIYAVRKALNMSLSQLGKKIGVTPQAVRAMEQREKNGTISLKSLHDVAKALNMQVIYALVPTQESLEEKVEDRVWQVAQDIVNRTSQSMKLEDQENEKARLMRAYNEKKEELRNEIPKFLWD